MYIIIPVSISLKILIFKRFGGTAEEYIPGNPAAKYLYVWKMARDCDGDGNCTEVNRSWIL